MSSWLEGGGGGRHVAASERDRDPVKSPARKKRAKIDVGPKFDFFRSYLLEILRDDLLFSPKTFLGVTKLYDLRRKKYGTLEILLLL